MIPLPVIAITLGFVALCVSTHLRSRRIPNPLSGLGLLVGFALNALYFESNGLAASGAGCAVAIAVLLVPVALGGTVMAVRLIAPPHSPPGRRPHP